MPRYLFLLVGLAWASLATAQTGPPRVADTLSRLAIACLPGGVDADTLWFEAPSRLPFLGSSVFDHLREQGSTVLAEKRAGTAALSLDLQRASVSYTRASGGNLDRTIALNLGVRLVDPTGVVQHDAVCTTDSRDTIPRSSALALEDAMYPETRGTIPLSRWRRLVQPAVIVAATAAGTVLFFSLRSRRSDGS